MKKIFILLAIVLLSFGLTRTAIAQTSERSSSAREQAIINLGRLIDTYEVSLSEPELEQVRSICRDLQSSTIQTLAANLGPMNQKYIEVSSSMDSTIKFTANALRGMSEDSSGLDLASVHLVDIQSNFEDSIGPYSRVLDELLVIDCQIFPERFVAGLEEARLRQRVTISAAKEMTEFRDGELEQVYAGVQKRLEVIESESPVL